MISLLRKKCGFRYCGFCEKSMSFQRFTRSLRMVESAEKDRLQGRRRKGPIISCFHRILHIVCHWSDSLITPDLAGTCKGRGVLSVQTARYARMVSLLSHETQHAPNYSKILDTNKRSIRRVLSSDVIGTTIHTTQHLERPRLTVIGTTSQKNTFSLSQAPLTT